MGGSVGVTAIPCEGTEHPPALQPGFPAAPLPAAPKAPGRRKKKAPCFFIFHFREKIAFNIPLPAPVFGLCLRVYSKGERNSVLDTPHWEGWKEISVMEKPILQILAFI